jgi:hypothetical protein
MDEEDRKAVAFISGDKGKAVNSDRTIGIHPSAFPKAEMRPGRPAEAAAGRI